MADLSRVIDVTSPPGGIDPLLRGSGNGAANSTRLQQIVSTYLTNSPNNQTYALYFPIGYFEFASTVTFPNVNSFRVFGGGGMAKGAGQVSVHGGACTYLRWAGGNTGPLFLMQTTDGDIWENINFNGARGPEKNGGGDYLDVLIKYQRDSPNFGSLYHHFKNCTFHNAQRLFFAAGTDGGTAEFTFSKCLFNGGETSASKWTSEAFYTTNLQCVNTVFDNNCEFNNVRYCAHANSGGRILMDWPTCAVVGTLIKRVSGSQNTAGDEIRGPHLDGGNGSEGRKALYHSTASTTLGPVVIQMPQYGQVGTITDEFANITSFSGTNLTLTHPIRMAVGDIVKFVQKSDRINENGNAVETTIATRTSDTVYTTNAAASSLGFIGDIEDNYDACNGEALITVTGSDSVHLRNAFLTGQHMWAGRLARLTHSAASTGRSPKLLVDNCMAFWGVDFNETGFESLLTLDGTCYWRFENADPIGDGNPPSTFGNYGVFPSESSSDSTVIVAEDRVVMREYGVSGIEQFTLLDPSTGNPVAGLSFAAGDVTWFKDGSSQGNTTNVPAAVGGGVYALTLTAAERTGQQIVVKIVDQTVPAAWAPRTLIIDTYGNASARHAVNLNESNIKSNVKALDDDTDAASRQKYAIGSIPTVTVGSGSSVTTIVTSSIDPTPTVADQFKNRVLFFRRDTTTAALRGEVADVTASSIAGQLTVTGLQTAPVSGDVAIIV